MANLKVPYALIPARSVDERRANARAAIARNLPRLTRQSPTDQFAYIACYGPSLRETYHELRGKHPLFSMSGATKWLAERGILADYVVEMDPRESQLVVSLPPVPGATYLVASCVHPAFFERLIEAGNPIILWHTVNNNWDEELAWVGEHDPEQILVHAGSTVGLGSIHLAGVLGYTRFEIHGMDGSFGSDGVRHAGVHGGKGQPDNITWAAGGKTYRTSKIMSNAVAESINTAKNFPITTIWHGDGLTQALIREGNLMNAACADETDKVTRLRGPQPQMIQTPTVVPPNKRTLWDALVEDFLLATDLPELIQHITICEPRRALARYNTGSIPFESAVYLRAVSRFFEPKTIVEIGTFIGTSALALSAPTLAHALGAPRIYTCDRSNDCVQRSDTILTFPYTSSTEMLRSIHEPIDLFFFDGRIQPEDLPEIQRLSHQKTVYLMDDCVGHEKGMANVQLLAHILKDYTFITPGSGPSTLGILVPTEVTETKATVHTLPHQMALS